MAKRPDTMETVNLALALMHRIPLRRQVTADELREQLEAEGYSRDIRTIADRVQDATSMTLLFSAGVDFVQGDFLAPASSSMNYDFS